MARLDLSDSDIRDLIAAIEEHIGDKGRECDGPNKPRYEALIDRLAAFEKALKNQLGGLNRDRFRTRARDLRKLSAQLTQLTAMPDRVTKKDFEDTTKLMARAAEDLEALLEVQLPGCICRRIENDNYSYLDYADACQHHSSLHAQQEHCKKHYADLERKLKNELRLKLIAAALSGSAALPEEDSPENDDIAKRAIAIADETVERLTRDV